MKSYNDLHEQTWRIIDAIQDSWHKNGHIVSERRSKKTYDIFSRYAHNIALHFGTDYDSPEEKKSKERPVKLPRSIYAGF